MCSQIPCLLYVARAQRCFSGHALLKMSWIQHQVHRKDGVWTYPPPPRLYSPPYVVVNPHKEPTLLSSSGTRISPAALFIIVILAVLFFISGLLHLLVRFLIKHPSSSASSPSRYPEISRSDALQRQLQQLFHLHDSGLDQAFIDALPVFMYKEIVGIKEPFDCAVCLCEFSEKDKLRLLPTCSHAFHINCIDTWLLSNSTCPLCRGTLFAENPIFYFDDPREEVCFPGNADGGLSTCQKTVVDEEIVVQKGSFAVKLGKFRKLHDGSGDTRGETSSSNMDARRCFSMGSYQYVVGHTTLRVSLSHGQNNCDGQLVTRTDESGNPTTDGDLDGKNITIRGKADSYSVSKIWLWSKKGKFASSSDSQNQ